MREPAPTRDRMPTFLLEDKILAKLLAIIFHRVLGNAGCKGFSKSGVRLKEMKDGGGVCCFFSHLFSVKFNHLHWFDWVGYEYKPLMHWECHYPITVQEACSTTQS